MNCPNCHKTNTPGSRFCTWCGHELTDDRRIGSRRSLIVFAALMITGVSVFFSVWWITNHRIVKNVLNLGSETDRIDTNLETRGEAIKAEKSITLGLLGVKNPPVAVPVGTLTIKDITGKTLYRMVVPIVDAGWIALPMSRTIGGYRWNLSLDRNYGVSINGGVFRDFDEVGIWQTTLPPPATGPPPLPWNESEPLDWLPLDADHKLKVKHLNSCEKIGYFIRCNQPNGVSGSGVFFQGDVIVGWTFESDADRVFLWNGLPGSDLKVEVRLDDHYRLTFADSREEKWQQALAIDESKNFKRLNALIDAYQYPRKVTDSQLPPNLNPARIIELLKNLVADLASAGYGSDMANQFDRQILLEIGNPDLIIQIAELTEQIHGIDAAIDLIETVKFNLNLSLVEGSRIDRLHREFYIQLLNELFARKDWASYAQRLSAAQTEFPDDPQFHLFEVRLALADGDWNHAERLLSTSTVPEAFLGLVAELQSEIDRLKASEGKIVIRFRPGSSNIQVTAELNGELSQSFVIDTGATTVTIPISTARSLGIPLDGSSQIRTVYTVGGPVEAREVTIDEINLNGWSVRRVTALVLDIPGRSNLGLLGLNYLNRFDVDLQAEKGLLTLTPK
jgi:clan AA aspartic protease (TIGR02281 family)